MNRLLIALAAGTVLAATVYGAAAGLGGINSYELGAEELDVSACDSDGVIVAPQLTGLFDTDLGFRVTSINIIGLADACFGKTMRVAVSSASQVIEAFSGTIGDNLGGNTYIASPDYNQQYWFIGDTTGGQGLNPRDVEKIQIVITE